MRADFDIAFKRMSPWEWRKGKEYTNHPKDKGGPTKYGITEKVARKEGYEGYMKDLPLDFAKIIYKKKYWNNWRLGEIVCQEIADQLFQAAVNQGVPLWKKYLQRTCNMLSIYDVGTIAVDGVIGPITINALNTIILNHGYIALSHVIYVKQDDRYDKIVERSPSQKWARKGWKNRTKAFLITTKNGRG